MDYCQKIETMLEDVLKGDKDPQDPGKGKNINYLCLSKLSWLTDTISGLQDLAVLLSDEQIQSVNLSNSDLALKNLYSFLDMFGNKLTYGQFYGLVSNFNNTKTVLLNNSAPNQDNNKSSGFLAKITLISNFINEKEKEFKNKYSDIDNKFGNTKFDLDSIINTVAKQKYPGCLYGEKQLEYYKKNTHHRELYEKSDNTENICNDLKVGTDDKILDKLTTLNDDLNNKIKELNGMVAKINILDEMVAKIKKSKKKEVAIEELDKMVSKIKELDEMVAKTKELSEIVAKIKESDENVVTIKELVETVAKIKKSEKEVVTIEKLDETVAKIKKSCECKSIITYFEEKLKDIKPKMQEFDQLYYGRKNKFAKLKTNFLAALGNLDTGKVSICFRNIYSNYMKKFSDNTQLKDSLKDISKNNKIFWELDPIVIKVGDQEKKYTFNEFFMEGFIKIQSEKHQDGTGSNFSSQQKQFMGIVNVVDKTE